MYWYLYDKYSEKLQIEKITLLQNNQKIIDWKKYFLIPSNLLNDKVIKYIINEKKHISKTKFKDNYWNHYYQLNLGWKKMIKNFKEFNDNKWKILLLVGILISAPFIIFVIHKLWLWDKYDSVITNIWYTIIIAIPFLLLVNKLREKESLKVKWKNSKIKSNTFLIHLWLFILVIFLLVIWEKILNNLLDIIFNFLHSL